MKDIITANGEGHVVVLKKGQILDAENDIVCVWDADVFIATYSAIPDGLLTLAESS